MQQGPKQKDVLVVVDEAHHITPSSTYDAVLSTFGLGSAAAAAFKKGRMGKGGVAEGPRAFLLGFTATPFRWVRVCVVCCGVTCVCVKPSWWMDA